MTSNRRPTQLVAPKAPRLPAPSAEYSPDTQDHITQSLRSYFAQIDQAQSALLGPTGARFLDFPYGIFFKEANQTAADTTTAYPVQFSTTQEATAVAVGEDTKLTVTYPGLYRFLFQLQFKNVDTVARDVDVWLRVNGVNVAMTNHIITVQVGQERRALEFQVQLASSDYVELMWRAADTDVSLAYTAAQTTPDRPATPSAYASVEFLSAVNSITSAQWVPPAPPAPTPAPPPPPPPGPTPPGPAPTPPSPAPPPPPPPSAPFIGNMARHPKDWLKIGNYMVEDNRWGADGFTEGSASHQYAQSVERFLTVGSNGEVGFRMAWRWPFFDVNGVDVASGPYREVKCYPAIIHGEKPGYASSGSAYPAFDYAVRLPDGVTVPTAPPGTPGPIAADWQPLGGSVSTSAPAGMTGGSLPLRLPLDTLQAYARLNRNTDPTGIGHLAYDIWLCETSTQAFGFSNASITHEIMIPLTNWGNYGSPHTVGGAWSKNPGWYSHDAVIGGVVYKVYAAGSGGRVEYNFSTGTLNGSFTNEETGGPRTGWKFIVFVPQALASTGHPTENGVYRVDIAGILNHLNTRTDSRGIRWARGNEYCVSVELGVEAVVGAGDLTVYDYRVAASAAPPPPPPPAPAPPPTPGAAPFYPFGSRLDLTLQSYPFGIKPTNYTAAQMDARVIACYNAWKTALLRKSPTFTANASSIYGAASITDGYHVLFGGADACRSEGTGYGMLIMVLMAGYEPNAQTYFNGMLRVARARPAYALGTPYLMDWRVASDMSSGGEGWSATDGDMDIAMALLMADRQWGSGGSNPDYQGEAINTINAMKNVFGFHASGLQYYGAQDVSRTSDYMPGLFRAFKAATGDTFWDTARTASATAISNIISGYSASAKLTPDFIWQPLTSPQPSPGGKIEGAYEGRYAYNAGRNPWRWGSDFIFSGDATWGNFASDVVTTIKNDTGGDPFSTGYEYNLNGTVFGGRWIAEHITGPNMVGAMCNAAHQSYLNALFTAATDNFTTVHYNSELQLLPLIVASGNWWNP